MQWYKKVHEFQLLLSYMAMATTHLNVSVLVITEKSTLSVNIAFALQRDAAGYTCRYGTYFPISKYISPVSRLHTAQPSGNISLAC